MRKNFYKGSVSAKFINDWKSTNKVKFSLSHSLTHSHFISPSLFYIFLILLIFYKHSFLQQSLMVSEEDGFKKNSKQNDFQQQKINNISSSNISNSLTDVNDELKIANGEIGRVTKWAIGFEKLLEDQVGLQVFTVNIIFPFSLSLFLSLFYYLLF